MTKPNVGPPAEAGADLAKGGCPGDADLLVRWDAARAAWRAWDVDDYEEKGWGLGADAARVMSSAGGALAKRLRAAQSARGVSSETIERIAIELAGRYCCSCPEDWDELTHTETCGAPIALAEIKQYLRHALAHPVPAAPGPTVADVAEVYGVPGITVAPMQGSEGAIDLMANLKDSLAGRVPRDAVCPHGKRVFVACAECPDGIAKSRARPVAPDAEALAQAAEQIEAALDGAGIHNHYADRMTLATQLATALIPLAPSPAPSVAAPTAEWYEAALRSWRSTDADNLDYDTLQDSEIRSIAAHLAAALAPRSPKGEQE